MWNICDNDMTWYVVSKYHCKPFNTWLALCWGTARMWSVLFSQEQSKQVVCKLLTPHYFPRDTRSRPHYWRAEQSRAEQSRSQTGLDHLLHPTSSTMPALTPHSGISNKSLTRSEQKSGPEDTKLFHSFTWIKHNNYTERNLLFGTYF